MLNKSETPKLRNPENPKIHPELRNSETPPRLLRDSSETPKLLRNSETQRHIRGILVRPMVEPVIDPVDIFRHPTNPNILNMVFGRIRYHCGYSMGDTNIHPSIHPNHFEPVIGIFTPPLQS
jgi:hypothetical protein